MEFEGLIKKFSPTVKRIAYKLNGRYRSFNHDDLYQEAFLHLWTNFNSGKLADKSDSYILQGCYFHLKNYIRKVNEKTDIISLDMPVGEEKDDNALEEILYLGFGSQEDCRDFLHVKFLAEAIQGNGFNPREKRILMFLKEGLTTRDIGKRIGLSHVSVVKAVKMIRKKAKEHFDRE
ncbi:MAG: sigma-70 family RNA polymerase sigma factor [Candidatus Omnitrophota bacterium]